MYINAHRSDSPCTGVCLHGHPVIQDMKMQLHGLVVMALQTAVFFATAFKYPQDRPFDPLGQSPRWLVLMIWKWGWCRIALKETCGTSRKIIGFALASHSNRIRNFNGSPTGSRRIGPNFRITGCVVSSRCYLKPNADPMCCFWIIWKLHRESRDLQSRRAKSQGVDEFQDKS